MTPLEAVLTDLNGEDSQPLLTTLVTKISMNLTRYKSTHAYKTTLKMQEPPMAQELRRSHMRHQFRA